VNIKTIGDFMTSKKEKVYQFLSKANDDYEMAVSKNGDHINFFINGKNDKVKVITVSTIELLQFIRWAEIKKSKVA
jgi:hypothetical protein